MPLVPRRVAAKATPVVAGVVRARGVAMTVRVTVIVAGAVIATITLGASRVAGVSAAHSPRGGTRSARVAL